MGVVHKPSYVGAGVSKYGRAIRAWGKHANGIHFVLPAHALAGHCFAWCSYSAEGVLTLYTHALDGCRPKEAEVLSCLALDTVNKVEETTGAQMKQGHALHCSSKVSDCGAGP